jgi:hypothetical protein
VNWRYGTRISVEFLLELFASGATHADVLTSYPHLTAEDVEEAGGRSIGCPPCRGRCRSPTSRIERDYQELEDELGLVRTISKDEGGSASIITASCVSRRIPSWRPTARPCPSMSPDPSFASLAFPKGFKPRGAPGAA